MHLSAKQCLNHIRLIILLSPLQPSPSQQINLGPSSNPTAKPSDFDFLKVIGKGSFGKVLLARHRSDEKFYAVKVLQKKAILKKKEVWDHIKQCVKQLYVECIGCIGTLKYVRPLIMTSNLRRNTSCLSATCY